ncbi:MAG: phosphatase PAP2 family protein [Bacteroidaceae bacterium]|nr:phosphatase PAP2 family protein [Bacteroidaceae bacterium]
MALELTKKFDAPHRLFAVETISLVYNLITSLLILFHYNEMTHASEMLTERICIALGTYLLVFLFRFAPNKCFTFVRIAAQMALLSYWYPDTFEFNRLFLNLDHIFASADQFLFNCQPAIEFSKRLPAMWVSEPLNLGYFSYYPMIFIVTLFYFVFRFEWFEKISFVLVGSFLIYYLIYIFVPVAGPQFYFPAIGLEQVSQGVFPAVGHYFNYHTELLPAPGYSHGVFYQLVEQSQQVGERPTAAFPSSHVGISTILMIMASRINRRLFFILSPFYVLLCCATVYIQAHYLVDVIGGLVTAVAFYSFTTWVYKKWFVHPIFRE